MTLGRSGPLCPGVVRSGKWRYGWLTLMPKVCRFFLAGLASLVALCLSTPAWANDQGGDAFTSALSHGFGSAALAAFVGGLLVSLTPCVYPMIAVMGGVFAEQGALGRWAAAGRSAVYVAGIVCMFVPLGVAAGLTGSVFGSVLQNRIVVLAMAGLFLAMGASLLGLFEFALPGGLTNKLANLNGSGLRGMFLFGLASGIIAAPCTGPVLTGILTWIARTQNAALGALAMAAFALGLGMPFFLVGAFALRMPRSGRLIVHVKTILGVALFVVALYFVGTAFPAVAKCVPRGGAALAVAAAFAGVGAVCFLVGRRDFRSVLLAVLLRGGGAVLLSLAGFVVVTVLVRPSAELDWQKLPLAQAQTLAKREGRPLLVDFTAAWCGACKELDKLTFSDPGVKQEAARFVAVRVDATHDDDPEVAKAMGALKVIGLPTVVLLDKDGREVRRFNDFVSAEVMLEALRRVPK